MDYYIFTPLLFILRIFEFCSQLTLSLTITNSKISIKKLCISSTCIAIIFEIFKLFIPQYLTSVLSAVVVISFIIFIFKTNYIKATAAYFITAITLAITDLVVSTTIIKLTHVSTFAELSQSEHLMTIGRVAITLIIFLISLILKFIKQTPKEEAISNITEGINKIYEKTTDVMILLEYMAGKGNEVGTSIDELKSIIDKINDKDRVGVCIDTCHMNDSGVDIAKFDEFLDEFDNKIGINKIKCVHVNDSLNPIGSHKDRHANIGYGTIGFDNLINVVYNDRLEGIPFILETPYVNRNDKDAYAPYKMEIESIRNKKFIDFIQ